MIEFEETIEEIHRLISNIMECAGVIMKKTGEQITNAMKQYLIPKFA